MAKREPRPDVCGRMFHGAQFDLCDLPPRHEEDHRGKWTGLRYRSVDKTHSTVTGLREGTFDKLEEPNLFKGEAAGGGEVAA